MDELRNINYIINNDFTITPGDHILEIEIVDSSFNRWKNSLNFTVNQVSEVIDE